ncbi:MAG TPA: GIY-YIG nuclease family protein [Candidatus Paceibacterota bacterium]
MIYTVYVLVDSRGKLYKGMTSDLVRRLIEHKRGKTLTTKRMKDLKVVYTEEYPEFAMARKRELYLKTAAGRRFLKRVQVPGSTPRPTEWLQPFGRAGARTK